MNNTLSDSELNVMQILWDNGPCKANQIAKILFSKKGWKKNTTYTLIQRLIQKKAVKREDPGYICSPLINLEETQYEETKRLLDKIYDGSFKMMVQNFIKNESLTREQIDEIRKIIEEE